MTHSITKKKKQAELIITELKRLFPKPYTILNFSNHWELLIAVALSAQCTDKQVNKVTKNLFKKYINFEDYLNANIPEFEQDIKSIGLYKTKAKNILNAAQILKIEFNGIIPKTINELIILPGVGRKTASVVLGNAYGIIEGIAVDTHVIRISTLLGLTTNKTQKKIEQDLMEILPKEEWFDFTNRIIEYGRKYCSARKHDHNNCPLSQIVA